MEPWSLLDNTKWKILKQVSDKPLSMSSIAKKANTSVANISQHIKLLEAYGFVKAGKTDMKGKPGKPTKLYSLDKELLYIGLLIRGSTSRKVMGVSDPYHRMILNILMIEKSEVHYYLHKLLWQNEELIEKCKAISLLKAGSENIELFIVTDNLEQIRKNFSNVTLKDMNDNEKKIVCWTHNEDEVNQGLENNDAHFINLVKNSSAIHDPNNLILGWNN